MYGVQQHTIPLYTGHRLAFTAKKEHGYVVIKLHFRFISIFRNVSNQVRQIETDSLYVKCFIRNCSRFLPCRLPGTPILECIQMSKIA